MDDKKIILNKKTDLLKLSISKIMNTKLYNFKGDYYNQLYDEAMRLEQSKVVNMKEKSKINKIDYILFEIKFLTEVIIIIIQFGQRIAISGSDNIFGNWDPKKGYI